MKVIVYYVADRGVDGLAPERILYAFLDEQRRDDALAVDKGKAYRTTGEKIVNLEQAKGLRWPSSTALIGWP